MDLLNKRGEKMAYKTVLKTSESLDLVNKSKFIGHIKPISCQEEGQAFVETIKKAHWHANHNVPVYVVGENYHVQKYSDDGEPSGTAGLPILNMLKAEGITNVAIVVTRYFGGVKLGTGGLIRAYTQSAQSALKAAEVVEMKAYHLISVALNYTLNGKYENFILNHEGALVKDTLYTEVVKWLLYIPEAQVDIFIHESIDLCNDQCQISKIEVEMLPIGSQGWIKGKVMEKQMDSIVKWLQDQVKKSHTKGILVGLSGALILQLWRV